MKTALRFSTTIAASKGCVWHVLFDDEMFGRWTSEFAQGSYAEGDWTEGSTMRFLTPEGDGMDSVIAESRRHAFLSIRHLGYVRGGVDDTESDEVRAWAPSCESYTLIEVDGGTELVVDMDVPPEYETFFEDAWPRALDVVKQLAETRDMDQRSP